jgi:hypothetical protein
MKVAVVVCLLAGVSVATLVAARRTFGATPEKYLHIRVNDSESKESVNVNLPLSLAEKILPTINHGDLKNGRVSIGHSDMDNVDLHAILEALRNAPDDEFVTVKSDSEDVRVAKSKDNLIIHVHETPKPKTDKAAGKDKDADKDADRDNEKPQKVEITIPMSVVNALVPNDKKEIDVVAAIHALANASQSLMVTVHDATSDVRIWVDANGSGDEK